MQTTLCLVLFSAHINFDPITKPRLFRCGCERVFDVRMIAFEAVITDHKVSAVDRQASEEPVGPMYQGPRRSNPNTFCILFPRIDLTELLSPDRHRKQ